MGARGRRQRKGGREFRHRDSYRTETAPPKVTIRRAFSTPDRVGRSAQPDEPLGDAEEAVRELRPRPTGDDEASEHDANRDACRECRLAGESPRPAGSRSEEHTSEL